MTIPPLQEHFPSLVLSWVKGKNLNDLLVFSCGTRRLSLAALLVTVALTTLREKCKTSIINFSSWHRVSVTETRSFIPYKLTKKIHVKVWCCILCLKKTAESISIICVDKSIIMKWAQWRQYTRPEQKYIWAYISLIISMTTALLLTWWRYLCITTATSSNWIKLHLCTL